MTPEAVGWLVGSGLLPLAAPFMSSQGRQVFGRDPAVAADPFAAPSAALLAPALVPVSVPVSVLAPPPGSGPSAAPPAPASVRPSVAASASPAPLLRPFRAAAVVASSSLGPAASSPAPLGARPPPPIDTPSMPLQMRQQIFIKRQARELQLQQEQQASHASQGQQLSQSQESQQAQQAQQSSQATQSSQTEQAVQAQQPQQTSQAPQNTHSRQALRRRRYLTAKASGPQSSQPPATPQRPGELGSGKDWPALPLPGTATPSTGKSSSIKSLVNARQVSSTSTTQGAKKQPPILCYGLAGSSSPSKPPSSSSQSVAQPTGKKQPAPSSSSQPIGGSSSSSVSSSPANESGLASASVSTETLSKTQRMTYRNVKEFDRLRAQRFLQGDRSITYEMLGTSGRRYVTRHWHDKKRQAAPYQPPTVEDAVDGEEEEKQT
ncbi:hypothetical protein B0H63DRAFT_450425 [Podospora didyma]|uniref:Uncharacterized protein n=1 Tax=Podospora didyma TaxID=330526 RepID=A0AAE0NGH1_9PEZI|nr:hypothetical protein B0H63DRAFT_450425 [Podospora didyma]